MSFTLMIGTGSSSSTVTVAEERNTEALLEDSWIEVARDPV
jgi:hypothetical protein